MHHLYKSSNSLRGETESTKTDSKMKYNKNKLFSRIQQGLLDLQDKWLSMDEFNTLFETIFALLQMYKDSEVSNFIEAYKYQLLLITAFEISTGGQRSEVIAKLTVQNLDRLATNPDCYTVVNIFQEKPGFRDEGRIIVPKILTPFLHYWIHTGKKKQ